MPLAYGIGGLIKVPQGAITGNGPPPASFRGELGQQYFDISDPANPVLYIYNGNSWQIGGIAEATTTAAGIVELSTLAELQTGTAPAGAVPTANDVATVIQGIVVGAVPAATEGQAGIAEIATQVETDAGTDDTRIVTPLKLANFVGGGGFPGVFTDLTATGTVSFTGATGGITMTSATASSFGTTGAGIDLTLSSAAGRVVVNGEEAAADAVRILSAAGGLDVDVALQMNLASSQNAADAIRIVASAGGIDVDAVGAAGEDINILNTGGSVVISATESAADSIQLISTAGGIDISASGAAAGEDIDIVATGSSVNIRSTENVGDSIVLESTAGGLQILASGAAAGEDIVVTATGSSIRLTATESATDAINIEATTGGVNILASGAAAGEDINLTATGSSINLSATENAALAISLNTNGGTSETIRIRNQQGTSAASIELVSTAGGLTLTGGLGTADAVNIVASAAGGGIDIDSGTAGIIADTTGAISLDSAAASNFTVTGAFALDVGSTLGKVTLSSGQSAADSVVITSFIGGIDILAAGAAAGEDIDIIATGSSVNIQATESDVNAITINASGAAGGVNMDAGTSGVIVDTTGAISLDSAAASNFTVTGAFDLTVSTTLGSLIMNGGEDAADAVVISAGAGGIDILATGAAGQDIDIVNTGGSVNISATESAADSITIISTAGGIDISASGAAAGEDIDITATGSSINITATENVTDAIVINASGAASALQLDAGTGSVRIGTGLVVAVTPVVFADSPYTVLGTDYFISVDSSGGAVTVTLPAATALAGRTFVIRDTGGAAAVNNITIGGGGTNLVGGGAAAATKVLSAAYAGATVYSNGTTWNYAAVV
jgi:hypothetical protein